MREYKHPSQMMDDDVRFSELTCEELSWSLDNTETTTYTKCVFVSHIRDEIFKRIT